jgi:hypothetical protein
MLGGVAGARHHVLVLVPQYERVVDGEIPLQQPAYGLLADRRSVLDLGSVTGVVEKEIVQLVALLERSAAVGVDQAGRP